MKVYVIIKRFGDFSSEYTEDNNDCVFLSEEKAKEYVDKFNKEQSKQRWVTEKALYEEFEVIE